PSFSHLLRFIAMSEQINNSVSECRHVAKRNHEAIVFVLNCFTASTYICHNAGHPYGRCLHYRNWKALSVRRKNKDVHQRIEHWHVLTRASKYAMFANSVTFR